MNDKGLFCEQFGARASACFSQAERRQVGKSGGGAVLGGDYAGKAHGCNNAREN
jgi:hypothetical protein